MTDLMDVVAVDMKTHAVRMIDTGKTQANATTIVNMAVMRRGCEDEFFAEVTAGSYKAGDTWSGTK